jgi:hypothetical protein
MATARCIAGYARLVEFVRLRRNLLPVIGLTVGGRFPCGSAIRLRVLPTPTTPPAVCTSPPCGLAGKALVTAERLGEQPSRSRTGQAVPQPGRNPFTASRVPFFVLQCPCAFFVRSSTYFCLFSVLLVFFLAFATKTTIICF